jgi:hypothetical protein
MSFLKHERATMHLNLQARSARLRTLNEMASHICGELTDLIESAVHNGATKSLLPQVTQRNRRRWFPNIREISNRPRETKTRPF